jgi:hypothetical protein
MLAESASSVVAPLVDDYAEIVEGFDDGLHVAANLGARADGDLVGFFDGDDASVGPGVFRDGVERGGQVGDTDVQVATASADGPQHSAYAKAAGVAVGDDYVQGCHGALYGDVGILPEIEALYGHVAGLRRGRDQLHLLAGEVGLLLVFGGEGVLLGYVWDGRPGTAGEGEGNQKGERVSRHEHQHTKRLLRSKDQSSLRILQRLAFRPGPLRVARSLRDGSTPSVGASVGRGQDSFADHREAQGEAGIHVTK